MMHLVNGWAFNKAIVLTARSIGKHWRAEFHACARTHAHLLKHDTIAGSEVHLMFVQTLEHDFKMVILMNDKC